MGFWKKISIFNMLTSENTETRNLGTIIALDEYEKEQENNYDKYYSEESFSCYECSNCHNIMQEKVDKCTNCGKRFKNDLSSNKNGNTKVNIYDKQGNIINIGNLKKQNKKFYKAGINIDSGDYFFFSPENKGMYILGAGEIDGPSDMYDVLDIDDYCVTGIFVRLFDSDSLFIDNGFLININLISKVEYINPNGFYSYRIGIDLPEGKYYLKLHDEKFSAHLICYDKPRIGRPDLQKKAEAFLESSIEINVDNGIVMCLDRNIFIDKIEDFEENEI